MSAARQGRRHNGGVRSDREHWNVSVVEMFRDAFASGEGYLDFLDEDANWHVFHSVYEGAGGIMRLREIVATLYPHGYTTEVQAMVAEGNRVVVQQTISAVTNSGADYFNYYVIVYELDDKGLITAVWEYLNNVYAQEKFDLTQL